MKYWLLLLLGAVGSSMIGGTVLKELLRTFQEVPASSVVLAGLIPLMLTGQFVLARKRRMRVRG